MEYYWYYFKYENILFLQNLIPLRRKKMRLSYTLKNQEMVMLVWTGLDYKESCRGLRPFWSRLERGKVREAI